MRYISFLFLTLTLFIRFSYALDLKDGDIIFHTSNSTQSRAIQLAMHSPYSHMGMIVFRNNKPFVLEASKTVRFTPLQEWIARGNKGAYVVKRLSDQSIFQNDGLEKLEMTVRSLIGKPYDKYFEWSDDSMYCSELVWKLYERTFGIRLGSFKSLREFDLSHPHVKEMLSRRYGESIPQDEPIISPKSIFESELLHTIHSSS